MVAAKLMRRALAPDDSAIAGRGMITERAPIVEPLAGS